MSGLRSCLPFDIAILWMLLDATLAVNLGVAALLSMVLADGGHFGTRVLGGYLLAFAVLILLLVVTMPPWVLTYVPFMLSYIGKGNLYVFMGLVALPDKVGNERVPDGCVIASHSIVTRCVGTLVGGVMCWHFIARCADAPASSHPRWATTAAAQRTQTTSWSAAGCWWALAAPTSWRRCWRWCWAAASARSRTCTSAACYPCAPPAAWEAAPAARRTTLHTARRRGRPRALAAPRRLPIR